MYLSETLARDRYQESLDRAHDARRAHQAAALRRMARMRQRAERRLLEAWRRADELYAALDVAP